MPGNASAVNMLIKTMFIGLREESRSGDYVGLAWNRSNHEHKMYFSNLQYLIGSHSSGIYFNLW